MILVALTLAGCDSNPVDDGGDPGSDREVSGRVTDDGSYGKRASAPSMSRQGQSAPGEIEGAVVSATSVDAGGQTEQLEVSGQTETNAEGRYRIDVQDASEVLLVTAEKGTEFSSRTVVYARNQSEVDAQPMTVESKGEAEVYVEAKQQDEGEASVSIGDVAAHVNGTVAGNIESGNAAASDVAASLVSAAEAEAAYFAEANSDSDDNNNENVDNEEVRRQENDAFLALQAELSATSTGSSEAQAALESFERAVADAYAETGVSLEGQAKARQAGAAAATVNVSSSSSTELNLRKSAEILSSLATALAIEQNMEAETNADVDALIQARQDLVANLRAASDAEAIANAKADYRSDVEAALAAELGVDAAVISNAQSSIEAFLSTLRNALSLNASAEAVAGAYATFYGQAESDLQTTLENAGATDAELGSEVLILLSGMASMDS